MNRLVDEIDGEIVRPAPPGTFEPRLFAIALEALSARALLWVSLMSAGALWGYVAFHPDSLRLAIAVAYSLTIIWPVLWRDTRGG